MRYGDFSKEVEARVKEELSTVDAEALYDHMLDDVYNLASVGGPFACMSPSGVLKAVDETAYRCGFNDWLDGEELAEIDGDYYSLEEVEEIEQQIEDEKEDKKGD